MNRLEEVINEWELENDKKFINSQCADACGVKRQTFGDWRKGRTKKILGTPLIKVANFFNIEAQWLSDGTGKKHINNTDKSNLKEQPSSYEVTTNSNAPLKFEIDPLRLEEAIDMLKEDVSDWCLKPSVNISRLLMLYYNKTN